MYEQDSSSASVPRGPSADTVLFNASKKELFLPSSGYKTLQNRLKVNWNVSLQQDDITLERLSAARLVVFGGPRDKFSANEVRKSHLFSCLILFLGLFSAFQHLYGFGLFRLCSIDKLGKSKMQGLSEIAYSSSLIARHSPSYQGLVHYITNT